MQDDILTRLEGFIDLASADAAAWSHLGKDDNGYDACALMREAEMIVEGLKAGKVKDALDNCDVIEDAADADAWLAAAEERLADIS
jgi:hypothetical protein